MRFGGPWGGAPRRGAPQRASKSRDLDFTAFEVEGEPAGEPRARKGQDGRIHRDHSADAWKHGARAACRLALLRGGVTGLVPLGVAVAVEMTFRFRRPKSHHVAGRRDRELKAGAPTFHTSKPDADNLGKALVDALGGFDGCPHLVWCDDQQVAWAPPLKLWADPGQEPGAHVAIYRLEKDPTIVEPILTVDDLTLGETLEVSRRRAGLSQGACAALYGVAAGRYHRWELGESGPPRANLRRLEAHEEAFVLRRRSGLSPREVAGWTGLSAWWIGKAERGEVRNVDVLLEWWRRMARSLREVEELLG